MKFLCVLCLLTAWRWGSGYDRSCEGVVPKTVAERHGENMENRVNLMKSLGAAILKWCQPPTVTASSHWRCFQWHFSTARNISECVFPPAWTRIWEKPESVAEWKWNPLHRLPLQWTYRLLDHVHLSGLHFLLWSTLLRDRLYCLYELGGHDIKVALTFTTFFGMVWILNVFFLYPWIEGAF